ncbi:hypothetical protein Q9L42_020380 (plasmid) [Methylomarinum sp. Ch1-1]|uniref:Uncharacterized protein n=1 Tax=Methylomarinum roseum TaxID=3067653 RepID=A0AAU7P0B5_9GAMM|nr:hypothetical protein [Methylomarinum sp. Ch1-1]MDP4523270.1 hypothetical protein [Methylomarinum sp. Ch1-1]
MSEKYIPYYVQVQDAVKNLKPEYKIVRLELDVDKAWVFIKRKERQYFEQEIPLRELEKDSQELAERIVRLVENYWTGWGYKKGLRDLKSQPELDDEPDQVMRG